MKTSADDFSLCQEESNTLSEGGGSSRTIGDDKDGDIPSIVEHSEEKEDFDFDKFKRFFNCTLKSLEKEEEGKGMGDLLLANEYLTSQLKDCREEVLQLRQECNRLKVGNSKELYYSLASLKGDIAHLQQDVQHSIQSSEVDSSEFPTSQADSPQICWKFSQKPSTSAACDYLACPPLCFGKRFKWSVKLISSNGSVCQVGVASTVHKIDVKECLGDQKYGWCYDNGGRAAHAGKVDQDNLPKISNGTKLTFLFDLTGNGTLVAYLNDNVTNPIPLFVNMKSAMGDVEGILFPGFVPYASIHGKDGCGVEFLGFEDV